MFYLFLEKVIEMDKMDKKNIIKELYKESAYSKDAVNKTEFNPQSVGSPIYGEVVAEGADSMVKKFEKHFNENTVFYDLGSGLGKMVIHIGLQYGVKKSIGIEFSKERSCVSERLKQEYAKDAKNIEFYCGNILDYNLSDANVIYMDNTVFPNHISRKIFDKLPKGCLVLYKSPYNKSNLPEGFDVSKQNYSKNLVKRTYNQNSLFWYFK
tara:strand:+ start:3216 stop:3845 length:630 start_codon:yes stop_codon:yes gene_type:complete